MLQYAVTTTAKKTTKVSELKSMAKALSYAAERSRPLTPAILKPIFLNVVVASGKIDMVLIEGF